MRQSIKLFKAALPASCLAIAACSGSANSPTAVTSSVLAESVKAAAAATTSPSGTTIPSATAITDSSANVWTLSGGTVSENGKLAGYSAAVTLLLYDNKTIYQQNSAGNWWSWTASTWASSSDPRKTPSPSGTSIPATAQITDSSGNVWTMSGGVVYKNGTLAGYSKGVTQLVYDKTVIYQENAADNWWSRSGSTWTSSTDPVSAGTTPTISGSPATVDNVGEAYSFVPTTTNPGGGTLSFSVAGMPDWAKFSTVTGALTGTPGSAQSGVYSNIVIGVSSGGVTASLQSFAITVSAITGSASLSWTAPTTNTNGTTLTDLEGYTIHYGTSAGDLTQTIQVAKSATSYVVSNMSAGTYYFTVDAYATDGTESAQTAEGSKAVL